MQKISIKKLFFQNVHKNDYFSEILNDQKIKSVKIWSLSQSNSRMNVKKNDNYTDINDDGEWGDYCLDSITNIWNNNFLTEISCLASGHKWKKEPGTVEFIINTTDPGRISKKLLNQSSNNKSKKTSRKPSKK